MSDTESVLFANDAFYQAFADRDLKAMEDIWASDAPVSCIHPGWAPLFGRDEVMRSWAAIISAPGAPDITCHGARARLYGDTAFVICFERIGDEFLIATNNFVRDGRLWRICHHQSGPTNGAPPPEDEDERPALN
jgi:ketosteroid isomerase-like protein